MWLLKLTIIFLCQIYLTFSTCSFTCLNQTTVNTDSPPIYINDSSHDALILFSLNCSNDDHLAYGNVSMTIDNSRSIDLKNSSSFRLDLRNQTENLTFSLVIQGRLLGYSHLSIHIDYFNQTDVQFNFSNNLQIYFAVKRQSTVLDTIFTVVVIILVCIGTFLIGCRLVTQNLLANIRRPIPILIGLFSQFLCLPLVSSKSTQIFHFFKIQSYLVGVRFS